MRNVLSAEAVQDTIPKGSLSQHILYLLAYCSLNKNLYICDCSIYELLLVLDNQPFSNDCRKVCIFLLEYPVYLISCPEFHPTAVE